MQRFLCAVHPSWCLYASFLGVICGVSGGIIFHFDCFANDFCLISALILLGLSLKCARRVMVICGFLAGVMLGGWRLAPEFQSQDYFRQLVGQEITISGQISEDPEVDPSQTKLRLTRLTIAGEPLSGTIYVQIKTTNPPLERSDQVTLRGKLAEGFGVFVGKLSRPELVELRRAETGDIFARGKTQFASLVKNYIPAPEVDLGLGYLVGLKAGLSEDFTETLRAVGMTHVIVASGTHLGILALVSSLSLIMNYVGRKFTPLRLLSFVAMITLLINPLNFLNLGWQLSFASFFALLIIAPRLQKLFYGGKKVPWLASMLLTSLATTLICAPILIYNFGSLSLLSFIANLFILPTLPYVMFLVLLTGVTSFLPLVAAIFGQLATWLLDTHIWLVNYLGGKTMFILEFPSGNALVFCWYVLVVIFLAFPSIRQLWQHRAPP